MCYTALKCAFTEREGAMPIQKCALTIRERAMPDRQRTLTVRGGAMDCRKCSGDNLGYK